MFRAYVLIVRRAKLYYTVSDIITLKQCFGQFLCPSSVVLHCTHSNGIRHTGLLTACEQDQDGTIYSLLASSQQIYCIWHTRIPLLYVQCRTPDDGQRNCPKYV